LVLVPLSQPYLMEYGDDWINACPRRLYDKAMHRIMDTPGQQIVILSQVDGPFSRGGLHGQRAVHA
jgi:hypothetical protein